MSVIKAEPRLLRLAMTSLSTYHKHNHLKNMLLIYLNTCIIFGQGQYTNTE